ncbi:interleukin-1 receptor-associated kinase 1 [Antennarius striatus]|uniref:interleukin-1 receptor-associated kinase 1 n=1 Tax=Antennarius striatus TaxID=241820 RepID=UPI0035B3AC92
MSLRDRDGPFLYDLPPAVLWDFCQVMDGLSDRDWTRFASEVLQDQTAIRLALRRETRTDWVMNQWENRKGRVKDLVHLLEHLQLLRPRDIILAWVSNQTPAFPFPPPVAAAAAAHPPQSRFDPPPKLGLAPSTLLAWNVTATVDKGGGRPLPRPAPPPSSLQSDIGQSVQVPQPPPECSGGVMCWSYEEVRAGTQGFSPSLQVGEGGFGVVYRVTMRNTDCAVKRLKEDSLLDLSLLRESFKTEVDQLSKFRHPNIIELLGFSEGQGSVCLIYSYMENQSLEDQLHNGRGFLSWSQRVDIIKGASTALQFLHCPPEGQTALVHGDVKSSNILLDRHLVAKLADFGLARCASRCSSGHSMSQTASVGKTSHVRGTLPYLPEDYLRNRRLGPAVDVYSFGVVLLEVLTGRRALEKDGKSEERYLKNLGDEVEESPGGSSAASWRKHLDQRLITGQSAEPSGWMETVALACRCLDKHGRKRPAMTKVFDKLQDVDNIVKKTSSCFPTQSSPRQPHPHPLDSSVEALTQQLSKLEPLEDTYKSSQSSSSSSFCFLNPPHPLLSSSSSSTSSSTFHSVFAGPCETDESRGFSQYDLQFKSNGTSSRSLSPSARVQIHGPTGTADSQSSHPSVPTEDQYNTPSPNDSTNDSRGQMGTGVTAGVCGIPESLSPVELLRSSSTRPSGGGSSCEESRGPEESDDLDFLPPSEND